MIRLYLTAIRGILTAVFVELWPVIASVLGMAAALMMLAGCATPAGSSSFWTQRVNATAWGINIVTELGVTNIGYLQWQRNPTENLEPAKPVVP